jgi:hypothetical protein
MTVEIVPSLVDRIKQTMVALKMPGAIEILDATTRRLDFSFQPSLDKNRIMALAELKFDFVDISRAKRQRNLIFSRRLPSRSALASARRGRRAW